MTAQPYETAALSALHNQFPAKLELVTAGVETFSARLRDEIGTENPHAQEAVESYLSLFERGGKRTRGVLTVTGYELYGGQDRDVISTAAGAIEAIHATLLVVDDVADASDLRRNGPTAHKQLSAYFTGNNFVGNIDKLGEDTAQMAAYYGEHKALAAMLQLNVPAERKILALTIINEGLARTGIGQVLDILSAGNTDTTMDDTLKIATYKTAYYSYLLPLQVGAVLAGAPEEELEHFEAYSLHAGFAFQLQDDIIGIFGEEEVTGKPRMSDVVEGKKTSLMTRALQLADPHDYAVLHAALGNPDLQERDFEQCLAIIRKTGALDAAITFIDESLHKAHTSLDRVPAHWPTDKVAFLREMASYGAKRQS